MNFFALDLHIGIRDIQWIFEKLGHTLTVWSLSDAHALMGWERARVDVVNNQTWLQLDESMCDAFYKRYKGELGDYDGFVCFYPPSMSMVYEPFKKPIIIQMPVRYETPFSGDSIKWDTFNKFLKRELKKNKIHIIANNRYDADYFEIFTGIRIDVISSLCAYTGMEYKGSNRKELLLTKSDGTAEMLKHRRFVRKQGLTMTWDEIADFEACVHIPYHNSLMSIFEQYQANIPLFFPTKPFLTSLCKSFGGSVLSEMTWNKIFGLPPQSRIPPDISIDPNNYTGDITLQYQIDRCDWYDDKRFKYIQYFDSFLDLFEQLERVDLKAISAKMKAFNVDREKTILGQWKALLDGI